VAAGWHGVDVLVGTECRCARDHPAYPIPQGLMVATRCARLRRACVLGSASPGRLKVLRDAGIAANQG
ncbi:hypothetical protein ACNJQJ_22070, partial [Mycobacterium tuberculosis]